MTEIKRDLVIESRKKRQKILQQVEKLLEWRHDLLDVNISELIDELAETREGAVAIEDVNQAYITLHGVTLVRREKDQALFWLSSVQHQHEFQLIGRVVDDLWKKEDYRWRVTKKLREALQPLPFLLQIASRIPSVNVTTDKLRELLRGVIPHVDLRILFSDKETSHITDDKIDNEVMKGLSEITTTHVTLSQELSWLHELENAWNQLVPLLRQNSFSLSDLRTRVTHSREFTLTLQLIGLLVDLGMLLVDTNEDVLKINDKDREFFMTLTLWERWDANLFLHELLTYMEAKSDEVSNKPITTMPRSIILSTTSKNSLSQNID